MSQDNDAIAAYLDAAGKLLVVLSYEVREGKLWEGQRDSTLAQVHELLRRTLAQVHELLRRVPPVHR
jgi:hypothetical protein